MAERIFGIELVTLQRQPGVDRIPYIPIKIEDVYEVVEEIMNINPKDLESLQMQGPNPKRVDIKMSSINAFNRCNVDSHIDNSYVLRSNKTVIICKPFEEYKEIRVTRVPGDWTQDKLFRIFSFYGLVKFVREEGMRTSGTHGVKRSWSHLKNGAFKIRIKMKRDIPSTLIVSNSKIQIFYFGQQQTCWRCGMDHKKNDGDGCTTEFSAFVNKFNIDDFPELVPTTNRTMTTDEYITAAQGNSNEEVSVQADEIFEDASLPPEDHSYHNQNTHTGESHINAGIAGESHPNAGNDDESHINAGNTRESQINVSNVEGSHIQNAGNAGESHPNTGNNDGNNQNTHTGESHINAGNTGESHPNANNNGESHINAGNTRESHPNANNNSESHVNNANTDNTVSQLDGDEITYFAAASVVFEDRVNAPSTSAPPKHSDTSDGEETIQAAYDSLKENNCLVKDYVVKKTEVDIHHTMDSQLNNQNAHTGESLTIFNANDTSPALNVDTEATLTAEEDDPYTFEIDNPPLTS